MDVVEVVVVEVDVVVVVVVVSINVYILTTRNNFTLMRIILSNSLGS